MGEQDKLAGGDDRVGGLERATVIGRASITIEADSTGGASFTVSGDPGYARDVAGSVIRSWWGSGGVKPQGWSSGESLEKKEAHPTIGTAHIAIDVDASGGVSMAVLGDPGRARNIADLMIKKVIAGQKPENYLGTKEYEQH